MEKRSAPSKDEAPLGSETIQDFYSDLTPLSDEEWKEIRLVALTPPKLNEPRSLTHNRLRIENARKALDHFRESKQNYLPPIFPSFEFEALSLMERR